MREQVRYKRRLEHILLAVISIFFQQRSMGQAGNRIHIHDGAAVMGKSKEYQRMGESESKSWNRSGTFMQLCKQGISCNAYCGCEMDILN